MKYTIEVYGKGAECIVHQIDDTKRERLSDGEVESDAMDYDEICEALEIEDLLEDAEFVNGVYDDPENYEIIVKDEQGNQVWTSEESEGFEDLQWKSLFDKEVFIAEDYQKGHFFSCELETEKFEAEKLMPIVTSVGDDRVELITGFIYEDQELASEFGDTTSKGFTWHLV